VRTAGILFVCLVALSAGPCRSEINRLTLGARVNPAGTETRFRVFSSKATRIELYLYREPFGADEVARVPLERDPATSVWSVTVSKVRLQKETGISRTVYYGYRVWGPNWSFDPAWTKGSAAGFRADVGLTPARGPGGA
jgi:glycogen operon protein